AASSSKPEGFSSKRAGHISRLFHFVNTFLKRLLTPSSRAVKALRQGRESMSSNRPLGKRA
ncbi:hypothetical protein J7370_20475, partial [Xanthomonas sp. D-93]|uniref:hypothetical protein n=1 Tax=Xanthomonas sp. D-93 TaxID=2821272 RepID=UPI001ADB81FC